MKKFALFSLLLSFLFLSACATQENYAQAVQSWQGADQNAVYRVWGYPTKVETLPNGHKVLVYQEIVHGQNPVYSTPSTTSVTTSPNGASQVNIVSGTISGGNSYYYECTTWFELDKRGQVLNTNFRGNNCVASKKFINTHSYQGH